MLSEIVDKLAEWWTLADRLDADPDETAEDRHRTQRGFARRVVRLAGDAGHQGRIIAARIAVTGLDVLRAARGDEGVSIAQTAAEIVATVLSRALQPPDFYTRLEGGTALICFATTNVIVAEHRVGVIAHELEEVLALNLGEDVGHLGVDPFVAEIELGDLREAADPVERLLDLLKRSRDEARFGRVPADRGWIRSARLGFQPFWEVAEGRTGPNMCRLDFPGGGTTLEQLEQVVGSASATEAMARVDFVTLVRAVEVAEQGLREYRPGTLMVPLHASTLTLPAWCGDYLALLKASPARGNIELELIAGPELSSAAIGEAVGLLEGHANQVVLLLSPDMPQPLLLPADLGGVSFDLAGLGRLADLRRPLAALNRYARRLGLATYALGANTMAQAETARDAGFAFIAGAAIHPIVGDPRSALRLRPLPTRRPPRWAPVLPA